MTIKAQPQVHFQSGQPTLYFCVGFHTDHHHVGVYHPRRLGQREDWPALRHQQESCYQTTIQKIQQRVCCYVFAVGKCVIFYLHLKWIAINCKFVVLSMPHRTSNFGGERSYFYSHVYLKHLGTQGNMPHLWYTCNTCVFGIYTHAIHIPVTHVIHMFHICN